LNDTENKTRTCTIRH